MLDGAAYHGELGAQRLLAQDVLAGFNGFDGLLGVHRRHGGHAHRLEPLVLQHLVVVRVQLHAPRLEVLLCPGQLFGIGREGGNQLGAGGTVEEVVGMAGTHAAETGHGDA